MSQKSIKCAILNILLVMFIGCATYPPPVILPDKATNFEYQYSVDVPQGWKVYGEVPKEFKNQMPTSAIKHVSLVMANKSTKSMILFINEKKYQNFQNAIDTPEKKQREFLDSMKTEIGKYGDVSNYKSGMNTNSLKYTYENYNVNSTAFKSKPWFETEADIGTTLEDWALSYTIFLYPCHSTNTCLNLVMLVSDLENKEINRSAFNEVLESIEMHDVPSD